MTARTVLITGGNRGIGYSLAEEFISQGHRVAVTARSGAGPAGSLTVIADVTDGESLDRAFEQVEAELGLFVAGKGHALCDQPFDRRASLGHDGPRCRLVAQAGAGHQGIGDVLVMAVMRVQHRGDAALGPVTGAVAECTFGNYDNFAGIREVERNGKAGQTAADNSDIKVHHGGQDYRRFDQRPGGGARVSAWSGGSVGGAAGRARHAAPGFQTDTESCVSRF